VERETWAREYIRLCSAYGRTPNMEQAGVYFDALGSFPASCIGEAVTGAIRESRGWPTAADLAERARQVRADKFSAPAGACDVCHGSGWVFSSGQPTGYQLPPGRRGADAPAPVAWTPEYARRCWQCRGAA